MVLAKAAKLIRTEIFQNNYKFCGTFSSECQTQSVPDMLLSLVRMILESVSITSRETSENGRCKAACVISQLMIFNCVKNHHESSTVVRHNEDRETLFPIYLGLMIHAVTRKRINYTS